jgi:hypothetical protein
MATINSQPQLQGAPWSRQYFAASAGSELKKGQKKESQEANKIRPFTALHLAGNQQKKLIPSTTNPRYSLATPWLGFLQSWLRHRFTMNWSSCKPVLTPDPRVVLPFPVAQSWQFLEDRGIWDPQDFFLGSSHSSPPAPATPQKMRPQTSMVLCWVNDLTSSRWWRVPSHAGWMDTPSCRAIHIWFCLKIGYPWLSDIPKIHCLKKYRVMHPSGRYKCQHDKISMSTKSPANFCGGRLRVQ